MISRIVFHKLAYSLLLAVVSIEFISCRKNSQTNISGTLTPENSGRIQIESNGSRYSSGITNFTEIELSQKFVENSKLKFGNNDIEWTPAIFYGKKFRFAALCNRGRWTVRYKDEEITLETGRVYIFEVSDRLSHYTFSEQ